MDLAEASLETARRTIYGGWRWLVFNRDHGSVAEKGPNPGTWEVAWPVKKLSHSLKTLAVVYL